MTDEEPTIPLEELGKVETVKVYNQAYVDKQEKQIEELEKENAELKAKLLQEREIYWSKGFSYSKHKLEEAKEIIRNLLRVTYGEGWNYSLELKVKAEQFLKEVSE